MNGTGGKFGNHSGKRLKATPVKPAFHSGTDSTSNQQQTHHSKPAQSKARRGRRNGLMTVIIALLPIVATAMYAMGWWQNLPNPVVAETVVYLPVDPVQIGADDSANRLTMVNALNLNTNWVRDVIEGQSKGTSEDGADAPDASLLTMAFNPTSGELVVQSRGQTDTEALAPIEGLEGLLQTSAHQRLQQAKQGLSQTRSKSTNTLAQLNQKTEAAAEGAGILGQTTLMTLKAQLDLMEVDYPQGHETAEANIRQWLNNLPKQDISSGLNGILRRYAEERIQLMAHQHQQQIHQEAYASWDVAIPQAIQMVQEPQIVQSWWNSSALAWMMGLGVLISLSMIVIQGGIPRNKLAVVKFLPLALAGREKGLFPEETFSQSAMAVAKTPPNPKLFTQPDGLAHQSTTTVTCPVTDPAVASDTAVETEQSTTATATMTAPAAARVRRLEPWVENRSSEAIEHALDAMWDSLLEAVPQAIDSAIDPAIEAQSRIIVEEPPPILAEPVRPEPAPAVQPATTIHTIQPAPNPMEPSIRQPQHKPADKPGLLSKIQGQLGQWMGGKSQSSSSAKPNRPMDPWEAMGILDTPWDVSDLAGEMDPKTLAPKSAIKAPERPDTDDIRDEAVAQTLRRHRRRRQPRKTAGVPAPVQPFVDDVKHAMAGESFDRELIGELSSPPASGVGDRVVDHNQHQRRRKTFVETVITAAEGPQRPKPTGVTAPQGQPQPTSTQPQAIQHPRVDRITLKMPKSMTLGQWIAPDNAIQRGAILQSLRQSIPAGSDGVPTITGVAGQPELAWAMAQHLADEGSQVVVLDAQLMCPRMEELSQQAVESGIAQVTALTVCQWVKQDVQPKALERITSQNDSAITILPSAFDRNELIRTVPLSKQPNWISALNRLKQVSDIDHVIVAMPLSRTDRDWLRLAARGGLDALIMNQSADNPAFDPQRLDWRLFESLPIPTIRWVESFDLAKDDGENTPGAHGATTLAPASPHHGGVTRVVRKGPNPLRKPHPLSPTA